MTIMIEISSLLILIFTQSSITVEAEEDVTTCLSPNNGAGPFWCYGSPLVVRIGDDVFVSAMETGENIPPLCNTRWRIFRKHGNDNWDMVQSAEKFNQREPCPLVGFTDGRLFLSTNPSTQPVGTQYGACDPHLIEFSAENPQNPGVPSRPIWDNDTVFTDHSYRGVAADGRNKEILLLNIHASSGDQFWSFRDSNNQWTKHGSIKFPIRSCYPQVALRNKSAHVMAISDIVEPIEEWRKYKFEQTKASWDYVFRKLFYTFTPNITEKDFSEQIEIDSVESTSGHILNLDLWIDENGSAHILYRKQNIQSALMRDKFFPNVPITTSLEYVVIKNGEIVRRRTLIESIEGKSDELPSYARFHVSSNGRLFVLYSCGRKGQNKIMEITENGHGEPILIPLRKPFGMFFTAIERGGSKPSDIIDIYGPGEGTVIRYARVRY
jgi:hypothetical protein